MNIQQLRDKIENSNGKIFSVEFVKKDGSVREMTARLGVTKHLVGGGPSTTAHIPKYMTVFDMQAEGYRNINFDTIKRVKFEGTTYTF